MNNSSISFPTSGVEWLVKESSSPNWIWDYKTIPYASIDYTRFTPAQTTYWSTTTSINLDFYTLTDEDKDLIIEICKDKSKALLNMKHDNKLIRELCEKIMKG